MKTTSKTLIALLALGASAFVVTAQDAGGPGGDGKRPVPPLMAALDANHDGTIDEAEIANASAALKTLDKNGDGKLTGDELRPARPEGGQGGPQGGRPQRPPGNN